MITVTNGAPGQVYLRNTLFLPGREPLTAVIAKEGLAQDIHVEANDIRTRFGRAVDVEVFVWDGDLISAAKEAHRRAEAGRIPETRRNKDVLHDFLIATFFLTVPTGVIAPKSPAPLDVGDIKSVLEAVRHHPAYKEQTVLVISRDGEVIRLVKGVVTTE